MADLKKLSEVTVGLTLLEAQELKSILKDEYGLDPSEGGAVMMAGTAASDHEGSGSKSPIYSEYDVLIASIGHDKFGLIREVRDQLGVGLKKAKQLVESNNRVLAENIPHIRAAELEWRFAESGAKTVLAPSVLRKPRGNTKSVANGVKESTGLWGYMRLLWLSQPVAFSVAFGVCLLAMTHSTSAFWIGLAIPLLFLRLTLEQLD